MEDNSQMAPANFSPRRISRASGVFVLAVVVFSIAGLAAGQTRPTPTSPYKTINKIPPFKGRWGAGSPVAPLTGVEWSDKSSGGGWVKPDPNYKIKRTPDGQPDIQGVWSTNTATGIIDPPNGRIPYKAAAKAKDEDIQRNYISPNATCVPKGVLGLMRYIDSQIVQSPGDVLIITEHLTNFRHIRLDGSQHIPGSMKLWMGDARGHWDGNTLVIDGRNFNDKTVTFHSDQLKVMEWFTPVGEGTLQYESKVEDPVVLEKPYMIAFPMVQTPNYDMYEENCHDGNRTVVLQLKSGGKLYTGPASLGAGTPPEQSRPIQGRSFSRPTQR